MPRQAFCCSTLSLGTQAVREVLWNCTTRDASFVNSGQRTEHTHFLVLQWWTCFNKKTRREEKYSNSLKVYAPWLWSRDTRLENTLLYTVFLHSLVPFSQCFWQCTKGTLWLVAYAWLLSPVSELLMLCCLLLFFFVFVLFHIVCLCAKAVSRATSQLNWRLLRLKTRSSHTAWLPFPALSILLRVT